MPAYHAKRLYLLGALGVLGIGGFPGSWSYAAHPAKPVRAVIQVRLCVSVPLGSSPLHALARGIDNAVTLATEHWRSTFRTAHLALLPPLKLDDGGPQGPDPKMEELNATNRTRRHDTLGYVGPLNSPVAPLSQPILNRAGMVQISPSNTQVSLTSPALRVRQQPATYRRRLSYVTYYRVIATDALQGPSDAAYLKDRLHARTYFLASDKFSYGLTLAATMKAYAGRIGLRIVGSGQIDQSRPSASADALADTIVARHPDGVLFGGTPYTAVPLLMALRRKGYTGPLVGGDALVAPAVEQAGAGAVNVFGPQTGPVIAMAPKSFRQTYRRRFQIALEQYDAPAYDAANIILQALYQAAAHGNLHGSLFGRRAALLPYVAHVRWKGAIGITSFDRNGDTRNPIISMYAIRHGKWTYIGAAPKVSGVSPTG